MSLFGVGENVKILHSFILASTLLLLPTIDPVLAGVCLLSGLVGPWGHHGHMK